MIRLTALLLATAALTVPTLAADFGMEPAYSPMQPAAVTSWTGFYVGAFGGGAFNPDDAGVIQIDEDLDGNFDEPLVGPLGAAFDRGYSGANNGGFFGGIEAGYDYQINNFVVGAVVDLAHVDYSDRQSGQSTTPAFYNFERDLDWLATARVRAGVLVTENMLAYVHGGFAAGDVNYAFNSSNLNGVSRGGDDTAYGYQIGAGVETKVASNLSLGLEYGYTNLGDSDFTTRFANGPFGAAPAAVNRSGADLRGSDADFDFHTVKASLKYRF